MHNSTPAMNPFAAPDVKTVKWNPDGTRGWRASEKVLRRLCRRLAVAEVCYTLGLASFIASFFWNSLIPGFHSYGNVELRVFLTYLPTAFFAVTWVSFFNIHRVVQGWLAAVGLLILFPVPLLGSIFFLCEARHANRFLYRNGYQRNFIGGKPDQEERSRMAADADYFPKVFSEEQDKSRDGFKLTLSACFLLVSVAFALFMLGRPLR